MFIRVPECRGHLVLEKTPVTGSMSDILEHRIRERGTLLLCGITYTT